MSEKLPNYDWWKLMTPEDSRKRYRYHYRYRDDGDHSYDSLKDDRAIERNIDRDKDKDK
jgi:hypothetical protein